MRMQQAHVDVLWFFSPQCIYNLYCSQTSDNCEIAQ
jgi:hypothetical protein